MAAVPPSEPAYAPEALLVDSKTISFVTVTSAEYAPGGSEYTITANRDDGSTISITRSYVDFAMVAKHLSGMDGLPPLPQPPHTPWYRPVVLAVTGKADRDPDALEVVRLALDDWTQAAHALEGVRASSHWSYFLTPALRRDWPEGTGDIDLDVHDHPHMTSVTEWWYYNMHFKGEDGKEYSAHCALFLREVHRDAETGEPNYVVALHAAFLDVEGQKMHQRSLLDPRFPEIAVPLLEKDPAHGPVIKRAYMEMYKKNQVPLPDELSDKVLPLAKTLDFELKDCIVKRLPDGRMRVKYSDLSGKAGLDVTIKPRKKAVRHGFNGVTKGHNGDDMFYYFVPRCDLEGTFFVGGGKPQRIASGEAWYDHEFGGARVEDFTSSRGDMLPYAWFWAAVQLDNDFDISVAKVWDTTVKPIEPDMFGHLVAPDSSSQAFSSDLVFEWDEDGPWFQSVHTFARMPLSYTLRSASLGIDLKITATVPDQEFVSMIHGPSYWEGRVDVVGTHNGRPVKGLGYIEYAGLNKFGDVNTFFGKVGRVVRSEVKKMYPDELDFESGLRIVARPGQEHYLDGVDYGALKASLLDPVRLITDRGGKSWRSFAAIASVGAVGGNISNARRLLYCPEFLHVGSLIVDDVQDRSTTRRGGPAAHIKYGEPIAINAGSACYFQFQEAISDFKRNHNPELVLRLYDEYFLCLRAAHAGQALDLYGLEPMMEDMLSTGDAASAEARVLATHRLKTAAPAGCLARIGALQGYATDEQVRAIGDYFESIGIAFQIMDDVLNLRGLFTNEADRIKGVQLKTLGEDLMHGKVTMPVVKALGLLPNDEMRDLWERIKVKPQDPEEVWALIQILEKCGAIEACVTQSVEMVETAWAVLDPLLDPSFHKVMLRVFGWFIVERTM